MDELDAEMAKLNLNEHKIRKGFALVIVNEKFQYHLDRKGAHADRENIKEFCKNAMFTVNDINGLKLKDPLKAALKFTHKGELKTDDLTVNEMRVLFQNISTGDFSSYDAFICFISSHGVEGGILGVDGETIPVQYIVDRFKATDEYRSLVDKPKLFFTQNCRGFLKDEGVTKPSDDDDDDGDDDVEADSGSSKVPITIPTEADILVAYATVNLYESYRNTVRGSWFILKMTQVLKKYAHSMSLTDMLAIANEAVGRMKSRKGKKQMPCFTSTLRKAVYFEMVKSSETQPSAQESEELPAISQESSAVSKKMAAVSEKL